MAGTNDGEFYVYMSSAIVPGDIVEVTDWITTETMTVQNLIARLDGGTGHLTGTRGQRKPADATLRFPA